MDIKVTHPTDVNGHPVQDIFYYNVDGKKIGYLVRSRKTLYVGAHARLVGELSDDEINEKVKELWLKSQQK